MPIVANVCQEGHSSPSSLINVCKEVEDNQRPQHLMGEVRHIVLSHEVNIEGSAEAPLEGDKCVLNTQSNVLLYGKRCCCKWHQHVF